MVATGSFDTARIWELKSGKQLFELEPAGQVNSIAFSPDSRFLLTGGEDKIARLFETKTGKQVRQFAGHTEEIVSVAYSLSGNQIITGSGDKTARVWNPHLGTEMKSFEFEYIQGVSFTPRRNDIIIETYMGTKILDFNSGKEIREFGSGGVVMTPDENLGLVLNYSEVSVFDFVGNLSKRQLLGLSGEVFDVAIAPNFLFLLTGGESNTSGFWNLQTGASIKLQVEELKETPEKTIQESPRFIRVNFSSNPFENSSEKFASASRSSDIIVRTDHCKSVSESVGFSQNGNRFALHSKCLIGIFDTLDNKQKNILICLVLLIPKVGFRKDQKA